MVRDSSRRDLFVLNLSGLAFAVALAVAGSTVVAPRAVAATAADQAADDQGPGKSKQTDDLEVVTVTGSLIPQAKIETATPVTTITLEDLQNKGFTTIADAVQHSSFATGAVQGPQFSVGFTPGAQTVSFFGLSPSYTKYLIDGKPIADYPALYNGTDVITSMSGIPTVLVDSIDILPGGQSSIYGSDAIAGVINIKLKKKIDGIEADARYGWTNDGGGVERRLGLAGGFEVGPVNIVMGGQYEKTAPIWNYQRSLTRNFFANGSSPQIPERDFLVLGSDNSTYYFPPGATCAPVAGLFHNSIQTFDRPGHGTYCGSLRGNEYTINNGTESTQGYLRASVDVNDYIQVFTEALVSHDVQRYAAGQNFYQSQSDSSSPYYYFYDPALADEVNIQRYFSPEEAGGSGNSLNKNTTNSIRATAGLQGSFGPSTWKYILDMTYTENKLTEITNVGLTAGLNAYFANIMGPALDPALNLFGDGQPVYEPNYAALYQPITPAQYAAFSARLNNYSRTEDSLARLQVTNSSLFKLPGGDAGIALAVEGGRQGWSYNPDPAFLDGSAYLYTSSVGGGNRTRTAETAELRLPVVPWVTLDLSGRYDDYKVGGNSVKKGTYNLGLEIRPIKTLLLRGRYGTAFKVPTLSDEFQAQSGFFTTVTDYYQCALQGYTGANIGNCALANNDTVFGTTQGNKALKPITAKVIDGGIAWSPLERSSVTVDYIHWKISNEVQQQNSDVLLRTESACRLGQLDPASPTCVQALSQVQRDSAGNLIQINTPKVNVAEELLDVLVVGLNYTLPAGRFGTFNFQGSYTDTLKHEFTRFPGDTPINYLDSPFDSTEFKTKENISVTWDFHKFGTTLYVERYGLTPNYLAQLVPEGYATPGAGRVQTWTIANLSAKYEVLPGLVISANCNNLFNKAPPPDYSQPGTTTQPYNLFNYNAYGREYFVQANYKFGGH